VRFFLLLLPSPRRIDIYRVCFISTPIDADKQAAMDLFLGIESSTSTLPTPPTYDTPRRSYRSWFTPSNLSIKDIDSVQSEKRLLDAVKEEVVEDYWQAYYRPKLFTEMSRHFAFKVNTTDKFTPARYVPFSLSNWDIERTPESLTR
jgi:hypothetical protein